MTRDPDGGDGFLTGRLLVATPTLGDPNFAHAVIYLCSHSGEGAMGLVVNRPVESPDLREVLRHFDIRMDKKRGRKPIHLGGPVEQGKGFVLHTDDYRHESSMPVLGPFVLTSSIDVLRAIAEGRGPRCSLVALGYAGWGPGQLDRELRDNSWLSVDADEDAIFGPDDAGKWERAIAALDGNRDGPIDPSRISPEAGTA